MKYTKLQSTTNKQKSADKFLCLLNQKEVNWRHIQFRTTGDGNNTQQR